MPYEAVIVLVSGFVAVSILVTIAFCISIIVRAAKGGGPKRTTETDTDETRLIQEMHHGFIKMERRVESLETLLLDKDRSKESQFDRELRKD